MSSLTPIEDGDEVSLLETEAGELSAVATPVSRGRHVFGVPLYCVVALGVVAVLILALTPIAALIGFLHPPPVSTPPRAHTTVVISLDGFRWEYLERYADAAPTLVGLVAKGVSMSNGMTPSFPSKTFPNHNSIATGLNPESHGIVDNTFWSPVHQQMFFMSSNESFWWDLGEPAWVTAEKNSVPAGCIMWPGCTERPPQDGVHALGWNGSWTTEQRSHVLLRWLEEDELTRPRLVFMYAQELVDHAGHTYGPESDMVRAAVATVDAAIGTLIANLTERGWETATNLIVLADHGMSTVLANNTVALTDLMPDLFNKTFKTGSSPVVGLWPRNSTLTPTESIAAALEQAIADANASAWLHVYTHDTMPHEYYYTSSPSIPPILLVADAGHGIRTNPTDFVMPGQHGFSPFSPEMAALFVASGPDFCLGQSMPSVSNREIYPLVINQLLGISIRDTPANNGSISTFNSVLRHTTNDCKKQ